jgi:hypothetical protein
MRVSLYKKSRLRIVSSTPKLSFWCNTIISVFPPTLMTEFSSYRRTHSKNAAAAILPFKSKPNNIVRLQPFGQEFLFQRLA